MKTNRISSHLRLGAAVTMITAGIISSSFSNAQAQAPAVVGIDHVGINVPDLDQGVKFFHDMFGFQAVTQLGPFPMDDNWKKSFHIHGNAGEVTIVMMRAGDGSNIEVFGYKPGVGSTEQPYRDDVAATHFSLYTSDIKATKTFLEAKGIKFLSDIMSGAGDTAGESWVYLETPWGSTIELNSYPEGKGYEKQHPAVKLWSAAGEVPLTTAVLTKADLQALATKHLEIWNQHIAAKRLKSMSEIYAENIAFFDASYVSNGFTKMNAFLDGLQRENPGFKFSLQKIDNNNNMIRLFWNFGPVASPKLISGMDVMLLENGKVRSLSAFLDHAPAKAKK